MMVKISMAENFIRSAKAPTMSAGVMMMKVIWKLSQTLSGIEPLRRSGVRCLSITFEPSPMKAFSPLPVAKLAPK